MPSKHLNVALEVLSDIVKNPLFDAKELEKERKVIFEEIKMYHDNPILHVFDEIQKSLYTGTMKMNLAGTSETMSSIDRNKILKRFEEIYNPNNMILCVVGDAEFEDVVRFVQKNFGDKKGKIQLQSFGLRNESRVEKRRGINQANLVLAYHVPLANDNKCYAAKVLSVLMAGGMSSRLFEEIREKRNLAYAVKGDASINKTFSYNFVYVGTSKQNVGKVKKIILDEFEKVSKELNEKELSQVKEQIIGNHQISIEDSQSQMINLLCNEINGNAKKVYEFEKNIRAVKLDDVKSLAKIKKYSFFALVPQ
jgi:predicted Zn-dependent peptidase